MPKWLIVVLVVIAMLFVISLAAGSDQDRTSESGFGASLDAFERKDNLGPFAFVLAPGCQVNGTQLSFDTACVMTLGKASRFKLSVREVKLRVESGPVEITLDPASDSPVQRDSFGQGEDEEFTFEREGGTLSLACQAGAGTTCLVTFLA